MKIFNIKVVQLIVFKKILWINKIDKLLTAV
jgi:hypothetical protein